MCTYIVISTNFALGTTFIDPFCSDQNRREQDLLEVLCGSPIAFSLGKQNGTLQSGDDKIGYFSRFEGLGSSPAFTAAFKQYATDSCNSA
jgi:hypothetical protein